MQLRFWNTLRSSLRARFLVAFTFGAIIVTVVGAWTIFNITQTHLQDQLIMRGQLIASAINHSAMIANSDADLQHVISHIRKENPDIVTIVVLEKDTRRIIASSLKGENAFNASNDPHLWGELNNTMATGHFGLHIEDNLEFVTISPLYQRSSQEEHIAQQSKVPEKNVAHADGLTQGTQHKHIDDHVQKNAVPTEPREHNGTSNASGESQQLRGGIILHIDPSKVLAIRAVILKGLISITVLCILIFVGLAWSILQRQVIEPIADIRNTMKRQQSGDRNAKASSQVTYELNDVAKSFNVMIEAMAAREKTIEEQANKDSLTELPNRKGFNRNFQSALEMAEKQASKVTLVFLDLDNFKTINDTKGHIAGDEVLKIIAKRISECVSPPNMVARLGGDEFAIILVEDAASDMVGEICQQVIDAVGKPVIVQGTDLLVGVSIGVSHYPQHATDSHSLLKYADLALHQVKDHRRGSWIVYDEAMGKNAQEARAIEMDLRLALKRKELFLEFQPQIDVKTCKLSGVEALVRWRHPEKGIILPGKFIAIAESAGLIDAIGDRVLHASCKQAVRWREQGFPPMTMGVNVSAKQLLDPEFVSKVQRAITDTGIDPQYLELELTETAVMACSDEVIDTMHRLAALGVRLAIDDFGTGHSSLSRLKHFPLDRLKIDRSFIAETKPGSDSMLVTSAIIQLAKSLHMNVIAEGIETEEQFNFIANEGCNDAQGYLFGKPMIENDFVAWFSSGILVSHKTHKLRDMISLSPPGDEKAQPSLANTGTE